MCLGKKLAGHATLKLEGFRHAYYQKNQTRKTTTLETKKKKNGKTDHKVPKHNKQIEKKTLRRKIIFRRKKSEKKIQKKIQKKK